MGSAERPANGPLGNGLWFTPEERQKILQRAYPREYAPYWRAVTHEARRGLAIGLTAVLAFMLAPAWLLVHTVLIAFRRNGIAHASPAGHGIVWLANVHALGRARNKACKHS